MKWEINFIGTGSRNSSPICRYEAPVLKGIDIYNFDIVTDQLQKSRVFPSASLSLADAAIIMNTKDNCIRICTLQKGSLRILVTISGIESNSFMIRSALSPDGRMIVSGSENGRVLLWDTTGKAASSGVLSSAKFEGPVTDACWSKTHHCVALSCYSHDQVRSIYRNSFRLQLMYVSFCIF